MAETKSAVLLIGFGGPESPEDVRPFIENVVRGRNVPEERLQAVCGQYAQIGGSSPYNRLTRIQADELRQQLRSGGCDVEVFIGLQFSQPSIASAFAQLRNHRVKRVAAIVMAPHPASHHRYLQAVASAGESAQDKLEIMFAPPWHKSQLFAQATAARIEEKLNQLEPALLDKTRIIFSAHSVPCQASQNTGYANQVDESAAAAFEEIRQRKALPACQLDFAVGYQSRSGSPQEPWLEPDVSARIAEARDQGKTHVVVAPIGFLVDHVEVLFDLDVLAATNAKAMGITMLRAGTVFNHPQFIQLLCDLTRRLLEPSYAKP